MRKPNISVLIFFPLVVLLCTCNDPVFFAISQEVRPVPPLIMGTPTNFTEYDGRMYVASGTALFSYNTGPLKSFWRWEMPPGGNIIQIASTDKYLYALCAQDTNNYNITSIKKYDKNTSSWSISNIIINIQNIYSAGNKLFFYVSSTIDNENVFYTIYYIDDSEKSMVLDTDSIYSFNMGELCGVAYDGTSWYLATKNLGVYKTDNFNDKAKLLISNINNSFNGIINLQDANNTIFLITRDGLAFTIKDDSLLPVPGVFMGRMSTGALTIWKQPSYPSSPVRLLLAGRQDALSYSVNYGYTYGYLELELDSNGIKPFSNFIEPGLSLLTSVRFGDNERFLSTLGKQPVNYLFQTPDYIDKDMTLFAATQKSGVWSFRVRNSLWQWNAEGVNEP